MLASQEDIEQRIQVLFDDPAEPVVATLIAAAQGQYEREAGRPLEIPETEYVETYDPPPGSALWLRHFPIVAIDEITDDGTLLVEGTDYYFSTFGRIERVSGGYLSRWNSRKRQTIVVTYSAGYDDTHFLWDSINDDVAWMVAAAFQRGVAAAGESGALEGIEAESIGTYSLRYMASVGDPAQWIIMTEQQRANARNLRAVMVA